MRLSKSLVVGIVVAVALVSATVFALTSPKVAGGGAHDMRITFVSADGLVSGSDVLEAGAKIGTITDIQPQTNDAIVVIAIADAHWPLHAGVTADIRPKSLLGEKYVDLHDGPQSAPAYNASAILHAGANADPVELDQFINSLDAPTRTAVRVLLDELGAGVTGRGADLNAAIAAGKSDLANLAVTGKTLNDRDPDLDKILVGLDGVLSRITTSDQLTQMSQLITNGQNTLTDIESVSTAFSRQFTDANISLGDLNTALNGAVPSLRSTLNVAPALLANLTQESNLLTPLGATVTTTADLSPNGECTGATTANQPITQVTGLTQCSPLWELIKGLLQGPTVSAGALELPAGAAAAPLFRICIVGINPQTGNGACDNSNGGQSALPAILSSDGALFSAFLGT